MNIIKIDHIALATLDVNRTVEQYSALLGHKAGEVVFVPEQGVKSAYMDIPGTGIEIMEPTDPEGGIRKFIDKKGEGIHHIAVLVEDIDAAIEELESKGVRLIKGTAGEKKAVFIHPKSTGGVLIELCY